MNKTKKRAVCPGSFDPITLGHLDIITRASALFDQVVVLISVNASKKGASFSLEERVELARRATAHLPNITIDSFHGLLVEYLKKNDISVVVRGLRAMSDFEYEFQMSLANKKMNPDAETIFLTAAAENMYLSSSLVKQIVSLGGDISEFVPECIVEEICERFAEQRNRNLQ